MAFIFKVLLLSQSLWAETCPNIDLRSKELGVVRNQGSLGWCFAYTTADLLTHRLKSKVSAIDLGINFYDKMPEMPRGDLLTRASGGSDMGAMTYARGQYCKEEVLPSSEITIPKECSKSSYYSASDVLVEVEKIVLKSRGQLSICEKTFINALFKNVKDQDLFATLGSPRTSLEKISRLRALNCQDQLIVSEKKIVMRSGLESGAKILDEINRELKKNNLISLNYDADFLVRNSNTEGVYNHYSSIVGSRKNIFSNKCEYLIRNSWGADCSIYPDAYAAKCEDGNIWVESDVLLKSIIAIHYLK